MTQNPHSKAAKYNAAQGFALAALAAIGFSAKAIFVKLAYFYPVDAVTLLALRMLFSAPFFLAAALRHVWIKNSPPLTGKDYWALLILGLSGYYLSSLLDFIGLQYISAGLERLIIFLYPTLVIILSALFLGKSCRRREITALLLSYVGIGVVVSDQAHFQSEHFWLGAGFVFASTLSYAFYLIGVGEYVARIGASRFTAYAMLVASTATLLQFVLTHPVRDLYLPVKVYEYCALMAVFSTVLPVFMLSAAIKKIGSGHTSLIGSIGPAATLLMAVAVLDEKLTFQQIIGAVLVVAGVLSLTLTR
ncbi:MAG: DMT family transporter [Methylomonas sp.]